MQKEIKKFIKTSSIYFIGNAIIKLISFIMLPIYTLYITPSDFGKYDVMITYVTFAGSVLFFDIWSGMLRFIFDYSDSDKIREVINTSWLIFGISTILYTITFLFASFYIRIEFVFWVYIFGLVTNVQYMYSFIARGYSENKLYMMGGLCGAIIVALFNYILLIIMHWNYSSLYIAGILGSSVNIFIIRWGLKKYIDITIGTKFFNKRLFKEMIIFSIPLCLNSVAFWFLNSFNRIFIATNLSYYENGIYAISIKFVAGLALVTDCVRLAWQEMSYAHEGKLVDNDKEFYSKNINFMARCLYLGAIIIIPIINFVYPYFVDAKYNEAIKLIPMGILAGSASAMSVFLGNIFGAIKQTRYLFITLLISSIVNIGALYFLFPRMGVLCVNFALFLGFFVNCFARILMLKKYIVIKYDILSLFLFLVLYGVLYIRN